MESDLAHNEPMVIKPPNPFYRSFPFLAVGGVLVLVILLTGIYTFWQKSPTSTQNTQDQEKPLKGLVGTVQAVDTNNNIITVASEDKTDSYQVSNDVLISQLVLGVKTEEMKQFSMATTVLYLEDLAKKKGTEVYLVFDPNGKHVTQIQIYPKQRP